jgi:hypothetical protein
VVVWTCWIGLRLVDAFFSVSVAVAIPLLCSAIVFVAAIDQEM